MQEQNSEKTVALAVKTGKMSAKVLKDCMKAFLASQKNKSPKVYKLSATFLRCCPIFMMLI